MMTDLFEPSIRRANRAMVCLLFAIPLFLSAQEQDPEDDADFIELDVFRVTSDTTDGYLATNATSGTRLNTAIKDIPMALEVITADFIEDTGATDLRESLAYSAGVYFDNFAQGGGSSGPGANTGSFAESSPSAGNSVGDRTNNAVTIRGFTAPFQQRMGFRVGTSVPNYGVTLGALIDAVNIERNEVLRGPGALLYGIGVISGIINVQPKTPSPELRTRVTVGVGTDDYLRGTFDISGPAFESDYGSLNYRFATAYTELGDWTDHYFETREYYVGQLEYEFNNKLRVLIEYQNGTTTINGIGRQYIYDDLSNANQNEYRNEFNESFNWGEYYGGLPSSSRVTGPDTEYARDEETLLFNVEYSPIENLSFNLGYFGAWQETELFDVNVSQENNLESGINYSQAHVDQSLLFLRPAENGVEGDDRKAIRYWWTKRPQKVNTNQVRVEGVYTFETPGFRGNTDRHSILAGYHFIEDDVDFYRGAETSEQAIIEQNPKPPVNDDGDAYFIRDFYDFSPFRYNGEPLAQPGNEYYSSKIWYRGYYGVYHGHFLDDRLGVIAGLRHDGFQAYEELWDREALYEREDLYGPINVRTGTTREGHNFEEMVTYTSATYALNYKITESLSIYGLLADGVSPNTGQSDGSGNFFEPEQTESKEIGFKFDALDGRLSGTISAFQITRENATYFWRNAPNPVSWGDRGIEGEDNYDPRSNPANFRPDKIESGDIRQGYAIDLSYFDPVAELGWASPDRAPRGWVPPEGVLHYIKNAKPGGDDGIQQQLIILDYELLDETGFRDNMEAAWADARTRSQPDDISPIVYGARDSKENLTNASAFPGALVSFTDEATGLDFQLIYKPIDPWQIVVGFSHVEREAVSGFLLSDGRSLSSGLAYGTEYDIWVRDLERENYADPTDPSSTTGGGVKGLSLSFVPQDTATIWSNYKLTTGPLKGFEFGVGLIYFGSAQTSVPIGGNDLSSNLYGTPDSEAFYEVNSTLTYKHNFDRFDLRVSLNIYNIFDDSYHESRTSYDNLDTGEIENRRYFFYRNPRSFRLTASFLF